MSKNPIRCEGDICYLTLYKHRLPVAETKFDRIHIRDISTHRWSFSGCGYAITAINKKLVYFHHLILPMKIGYEVDHKDTDKLNNTYSNLRYATHHQNSCNRKSNGVSWKQNLNKWVARIIFNQKDIHLGVYRNKSEAIEARRKAEKQFFGEYAFNQNIKRV